jgi:hypothetical protein
MNSPKPPHCLTFFAPKDRTCGSNNTKRWTSLTGAVNNVAQIPSVNGFFVKAVAGAAFKKTQMWYYQDHKAHDW